ncbi:hypothetical protein AB6O49_14150 [Streptomyces sp. SBR177]
MIEEAAEEKVVMNAGERAHAAVHESGPFVQRREPPRVVREGLGRRAGDRVVDPAQPLVGEGRALGGAQSRPVREGRSGDQPPPFPVDAGAFVAVEEQIGEGPYVPAVIGEGDGRRLGWGTAVSTAPSCLSGASACWSIGSPVRV